MKPLSVKIAARRLQPLPGVRRSQYCFALRAYSPIAIVLHLSD